MKKPGIFGAGIASGIIGTILAIKVIPLILVATGIGLLVKGALKE